MDVGGWKNGGEGSVCPGVVWFLRGTEIERLGHGQVGGDGLGRLDVLLLHPEMTFTGGEGLGKVFGDEGRSEAGP